MRAWMSTLILIFCVALVAAPDARQAAKGDQYAGVWAGTWEGPGTGGFELTLENRKDGPAGKVAVTTDGGNYTADLKSIAFDGAKMTARYEFPLDPSAEVLVTAAFEDADRSAKGTWSLRPKGQEAELAGGTWTVKKK